MKRWIVSLLIIVICMTGCSDHVPTNPVSKQAGIFYQEMAVRCITDNYDVNAKHYKNPDHDITVDGFGHHSGL